MKEIEIIGGDTFSDKADQAYFKVLHEQEKSVTFKFNGVRVIMFNDSE